MARLPSDGAAISEGAVLNELTGLPARKPGQHAKVTKQDILEAAFAVLEKQGLQEFGVRPVAKKLGVSPGALYAHLKRGLGELKSRMAFATLAAIARPYRRRDTAERHLQNLLLGLLKAINGKQPLAQLIALELSADYLLCPMLIEGLLSVPPIGGRSRISVARRLDVAMTVIIGMVLVEGETRRGDGSRRLSDAFIRRVRAYPPDQFPRLSANSTDLMMQIRRRLAPIESLLRRRAADYAQAILAAIEAAGPKPARRRAER